MAVSSPGAGTPTGTVTFMDGTTTLGTGTLSTTNGVTTATFSTTTLAVGSHSITAVYSGDTNDLSSTSVGADLQRLARCDDDGRHGPADRLGLWPVGDVHGHGGRSQPRSGHAHGHGDVHGRHDDARHRHAQHDPTA